MRRDVVVFGTSELAELTHYYLTGDSPYEVAAFTVDAAFLAAGSFCGLPVVPFEDIVAAYPPARFSMAVCLGFRDLNRFRQERYADALAKGYELVSYVSSRAIVAPGAKIGRNCFIHEGVIVQPFASIGDDVVISAGSLVAHHARIGDHCFVSAQATILGGAGIGDNCVVGASSCVLDNVSVAKECLIGSGAIITRDTKQASVYLPPPAHRSSKSSWEVSALLTWQKDRTGDTD